MKIKHFGVETLVISCFYIFLLLILILEQFKISELVQETYDCHEIIGNAYTLLERVRMFVCIFVPTFLLTQPFSCYRIFQAVTTTKKVALSGWISRLEWNSGSRGAKCFQSEGISHRKTRTTSPDYPSRTCRSCSSNLGPVVSYFCNITHLLSLSRLQARLLFG